MDELIAFLKARLDEDEQLALNAGSGEWYEELQESAFGNASLAHAGHHAPARVLREVAAKRAILARYERGISGDLPEWQAGRELIEAGLAILLGVIRDLAAVYSDHPDCREEWSTGDAAAPDVTDFTALRKLTQVNAGVVQSESDYHGPALTCCVTSVTLLTSFFRGGWGVLRVVGE